MRGLGVVVALGGLLAASSAGAGGALGPDGAAAPSKVSGLTTLVATGDLAWVGGSEGTLTRLRVVSGRAETKVFRLPGRIRGLAARGSHVWVTSGDRTVTKIDGRSAKVVRARSFGRARPTTISLSGHALWLADDENDVLVRLDADSLKTTAQLSVPGRLLGLAAGPAGTWVLRVPTEGPVTGPLGRRLLQRVDASGQRFVGPTIKLECDGGIAVTDAELWVTNVCSGKLMRYHARSGRRLGIADTIDEPFALAVARTSAWVAGGGKLGRVSVNDGAHPVQIKTGRPMAVALTESYVWVATAAPNSVIRIDPSNERQVGDAVAVRP